MSEKRYLITAKTKTEKPNVMFLTKDFSWAYGAFYARICSLEEAKTKAIDEPTHCLIVEAKQELLDGLSSIQRTPYNEFRELVDKFDCKTVSTRKEKKPQTQAAPELNAGELKILVNGKTPNVEPIILFTDEQQETPTPEAAPAPKKRVGYVLYKVEGLGRKHYYFNKHQHSFIVNDKPAIIFHTKEYAQFTSDVISANEPDWQVEQIEF